MTYLLTIHPQLPTVLLAIVVGGIVYGIRRWRFDLFELLPRPLQSLPAVLLSAAGAALPLALGAATWQAALAMMTQSVLLAVGGHHLLGKWVLPEPRDRT